MMTRSLSLSGIILVVHKTNPTSRRDTKIHDSGHSHRSWVITPRLIRVTHDDPMTPLPGHSITYRIAFGPQARRKVFTLQTPPASDEPFDDGVGKVAGFSLHAGVVARANERKKLERLCRCISRPAVYEKRF